MKVIELSNLLNFDNKDTAELIKDKKNILICITTNGTVKKNKKLVMGCGIAKEINELKKVDFTLGNLILKYGNKPHLFLVESYKDKLISYITLPVKYNFYEKADINLIDKSLNEIDKIIKTNKYDLILIPCPGCGNGKLTYAQVESILKKYFENNNNVYIIFKK